MVIFRAIKYWIPTSLATIAIFLAISITSLFNRQSPLFSVYARVWGRIVLWAAGAKIRLHGRTPPASEGPFLVVANHASATDIPTGFAAIPYDLRFVSRPLFFKVPFLGWAMSRARHISLDPNKPREAARTLKELGTHFEAGRSVLIYPEGTRSPDGTVQTYKRGSFLTAIQQKIPILPLRMVGTEKIMPKGSAIPRPGRIDIVVGAPVQTKDLSPPDARQLAVDVEQWTRDAVHQIDAG